MAPVFPGLKVKKGDSLESPSIFGSPTWTRTRDLRINSPSLYRLSYRGIEKVRMIMTESQLVNSKVVKKGACPFRGAGL